MGEESFSVLIIDMFHRYDSEGDYRIGGFPTYELAREFARRWVRDEVEALRQPGQTSEELRSMWYTFGEDASVIGDGQSYLGSSELDFFIEHPATGEERDWKAVKTQAGLE